MNERSIYLLLLGSLLVTPVHAQRTLVAGDTLRAYYLGEFVQAEEPGRGLEGRWVVMDFWATWCRPCVASMPHLNELQREFACDSIVFLAITHEPRSKVEQFLETHEIRADVVLDTEKHVMHKLLGVTAIPRTFVIDPDRVVRWTGHAGKLEAGKLRSFLDAGEK